LILTSISKFICMGKKSTEDSRFSASGHVIISLSDEISLFSFKFVSSSFCSLIFVEPTSITRFLSPFRMISTVSFGHFFCLARVFVYSFNNFSSCGFIIACSCCFVYRAWNFIIKSCWFVVVLHKIFFIH